VIDVNRLSTRQERAVELLAGLSWDEIASLADQDLLTLVCWRYEASARLTLDWAAVEAERAAAFLAHWFVLVTDELDVYSSDLPPRRGHPRLKSPGTSVCRLALLHYCELLHESPALIAGIRRQDVYLVHDADDLFADRENNPVALTRGRTWSAPNFGDPEPVSREARARFAEREHGHDARPCTSIPSKAPASVG